MKIDTMRRIDRLLGVPLCALATAAAWAGRFRRRREQRLQKVLLIELSEMGSAVLVDPAMRFLAERGRVELYFVIFAENAASLDLLGTVPRRNVFTLRSRNLWVLAVDVLRFMRWARRRGIDSVIDLELFSRFTALLSWLSGAARRVGFESWHDEGLYRGGLLTHGVRYNPHHHISRSFMMLAATLLEDRRGDPYCRYDFATLPVRLARAPRDAAAIEKLGAKLESLCPTYTPGRSRLVLVNPNASDMLPQRRWMPERFAEVIDVLLRDYDDVVVAITGAPSERDSCGRVAAAVDSARCVNCAGDLAFDELVPLYYSAELLLTNDSGPAHFAAVAGLRTFVLFGPETPALYGPLGDAVPIYAGLACSPCVSAANHRKTSCTYNACLRAISTARVLALLRQELDADAAAGERAAAEAEAGA